MGMEGSMDKVDEILMGLGRIEEKTDSHGKQLSKLFDATDQVRVQLATMNGQVKGHESRLTRVEKVLLKVVIVALIVGGALVGADRLLGWIGR